MADAWLGADLVGDLQLLWEEPVDVAAPIADEAESGTVQPVHIEEAESGGIELCFTSKEFVVPADLTF